MSFPQYTNQQNHQKPQAEYSPVQASKAEKYCTNCGNRAESNLKFCPYCGNTLEKE